VCERSSKWHQADQEPGRELDRSAEDKTYSVRISPGATLMRLVVGDGREVEFDAKFKFKEST
jgi:hypothetical protein